jgi:twitching motility protein PilT
MSKPIYEIPVGGGDDLPRSAGRRSASNDFLAPASNAPVSSAPSFPPPQTSVPNFPPPNLTPDLSQPPMMAPPQAQNLAAPSVTHESNLSPSVGLGQAGSDPDLVAALNAVVTSRGSDLHISVNAPPSIRVDGGLRALPGMQPWDANKVNTALLSIMSEGQRQIFAEELELDFAYTLSDTSRFRVNIYLQRNVMGAAFRLIPTEIKQLAALGVPERVAQFSQLARGLVLVTGPTGSGKSTTLAAMIDLVNSTRSDHIVTVEDPIEFLHGNKKSLVNQREVGHDTHSFANALKHVLRQDPDVILIGELRDLETISVALTAAETGHLVFATLHTQDAAQTIDRVIDVFPPHQQGQVRAQLAATLQGVVCQTLVKKINGRGRSVATEILVTTPAISNLIREGKTFQIHSMMQAGRDQGMHTMDQHLADLVNAGQISHQSAYEKAHDIEDLKQLIQRVAAAGSGNVAMSIKGL